MDLISAWFLLWPWLSPNLKKSLQFNDNLVMVLLWIMLKVLYMLYMLLGIVLLYYTCLYFLVNRMQLDLIE